MTTGQGASLNGFRPFPNDNAWNADISTAAVDPNSSAIINFIGPTVGVHADFGSGLYNGSSIGIPYLVVDGSQARTAISFTAYGSESDPGPMPIPVTAESTLRLTPPWATMRISFWPPVNTVRRK